MKESVDARVENKQNSGFFGPMGGMMGGFGGIGNASNHCGGGSSKSTGPGAQQQSFGPNMMRTMMGF